jgi:hypothetical protein
MGIRLGLLLGGRDIGLGLGVGGPWSPGQPLALLPWWAPQRVLAKPERRLV